MSRGYFSIPAAFFSSDMTIRLSAEAANVSLVQAVAAVTENYNGSLEFSLEHGRTARVFRGTAAEYAESCADMDDIPWEIYENIKWYFDESTGTLTLSSEGAVPDLGNWELFTESPWYEHYENVKTLGLEEGITALRGNVFRIENDLIRGTDQDDLIPRSPITREQFCEMLKRYHDLT